MLGFVLVTKMLLQTDVAAPVKQNHPCQLTSCVAFGFLHLIAQAHLAFLVATAKAVAYCLLVVNVLGMAVVVVVVGMLAVASDHTG